MILTSEKKAFAKVNLYLKILGIRPDNYHEIFTVMHTIPMCDDVRVSILTDGHIYPPRINISCTDESVPNDRRNTAYKAAELYLSHASKADVIEKYKISQINIDINKRIPSQAGLGGGSSDAAAVLIAMNELFDNLLTESILLRIAAAVGADVPFFVKTKEECGSTALCEGIGEIVTPLCVTPKFLELKIEMIKPESNVSTKEAFEIFDRSCGEKSDMSEFDRDYIINLFRNGSTEDILDIMRNDFDDIIMPLNMDICQAKTELIRKGAIAAQLSGSGSAVFGIFRSEP